MRNPFPDHQSMTQTQAKVAPSASPDSQYVNAIPLSSRILVVAAVESERMAVVAGLQRAQVYPTNNSESFKTLGEQVDVIVAGVGPAAAAASTARALAQATSPYELVIATGIAGGFSSFAPIGSLVVASEIVAADLGAETSIERFASLDELGFGTTVIPTDLYFSERIHTLLQLAGLQIAKGPVLTLSTATGTASTAMKLATRYPNAIAEAMEGFGVAEAAKQFDVPVAEIRAISNAVGPRDRASWRITDALEQLSVAFEHIGGQMK